MSISSLQNDIVRIEKEIADVMKKIADETKRELDKQKQIDGVNRTINNSLSPSTLQSKLNQIRSYQNDIATAKKRVADLYKKQSDLSQRLSGKRIELSKEEQKERTRINKEQEEFQRRMQREVDSHRNVISHFRNEFQQTNTVVEFQSKQYDFFISHATEDKEDVARPLADRLIEKGKQIWLDELILTVGDSLRRKIDEGLKNSKFGIVILSTSFFKKNWTQHELDGLVAKEMRGVKVILPIWHKVTYDEVFNYSPTLADKIALNTSLQSYDKIVVELLKVLD